MKELEEKFKNMHLLPRGERIQLIKQIERFRPEPLKKFFPPYIYWSRCQVNVLIVCDGSLNFGTLGPHLSEFLTTFEQLESTGSVFVDYRVTLAHRGVITNSTSPVVVNHISNFKFDTSVTLSKFDQVWLFGFDSGASISPGEIAAITAYMNGGGGLFATGDHGALGGAMGRGIPRVKDMRYWDNFPSSVDANSEVAMNGRRRNDTNRPGAGQTVSNQFNNQADNIPQVIAVRAFGAGQPHPLLSISPSIRASGIIDIMPDHPHEGECTPETSFTVNGVTVPTQIIAHSAVLAGSTASGTNKAPTEAHTFPSISVWDGHKANVGRIVIDSTWHHFVNVNLLGLSDPDFEVIRQYYMNIARWMTRRKLMLCFRRRVIFDLLFNSQLIEANLNDPTVDIKKISLNDLASIGGLAEEILTERLGASNAKQFLLDTLEDFNPKLAESLEEWSPLKTQKKSEKEYYQSWFNPDLILWSAIGSGFIALRDHFSDDVAKLDEKVLNDVAEVFSKGLDYGYSASLNAFEASFKDFTKVCKYKK